MSQISGLKPKEYRALEDRISQLLKSKDGGKVNVNIRDILSSDASSPGWSTNISHLVRRGSG